MSIFDVTSLQDLDPKGEEKWLNMKLIDKNIDRIRSAIRRKTDPSVKINRSKVASLVLGLIDKASFRVGSAGAETFGVSTIKRKHIQFENGKAIFDYVGKKGVRQLKTISDPYYVGLLKQMVEFSKSNDCDQLFCYQTPNGKIAGVTDNNVRDELKELTGIRKVHAFRARKANEIIINTVLKNQQQGYRDALQDVVSELGHYRRNLIGQMVLEKKGSTAEKSYIHPDVKLLKYRSGGYKRYGDVSRNEGKKMSRKSIIRSIRDGNIKKSSRRMFFDE